MVAIDTEIARVVDAIATIGVSAALQVKLTELEQRKAQVEGELSVSRRAVPFPNRADIQRIWTGLVEHLGELHDKATQVELEAMRNVIKGL